jgi:hypothetical protein
MASFIRGRLGAALVGFFLLVQLAVLWMSVSGFEQFSIFCTGPATSKLSWLFGGLHLLFLALLLLGLLSIKAIRLRAPYLALLTAALVILPVQGSFVHRGVLSCDAP